VHNQPEPIACMEAGWDDAHLWMKYQLAKSSKPDRIR